jgi:hypothetical protein
MLCLLYYAYVISSTKLEIKAEQVLPGSKRGGKEMEKLGGWRVEMAPIMYARMNE